VVGPEGVGDGPVADYHRRLLADPRAAVEQWQWLREAFRSGGITFDGQPMPTLLRPQFVHRRDWNELRNAGTRLLDLAARVARRAFDGDVSRLCAFLGTPAAEARWVAVDPGEPDVVLSRLDAFLTPDGPRFIEINSDAPAGFGYSDAMAAVFRQLPVFRAFAQERPVSYEPSDQALVDAVVGEWRRRAGSVKPRIAIVDWADVKTRADQEILCRAFVDRGFDCVLADPRDMSFREGRLLAPSGLIDLVYRRAVLSELVAREDDVRAFLAAYESGLVPFVNTFRCRLSEDKAFFAILTDEAFSDLLTADERAFVDALVPWTRKVGERHTKRAGRDVDLVPHILENQAGLVLKPAHGYGGKAVFVGDETEPAVWEEAVRSALDAPWVVQERVIIPEEVFPVFDDGDLAFASLKVNTNPFYVRGARSGAVTRCSRSSIINVSAGGGSIPTFVVD
jgi:uncharacterized circularly permuted ATP-grasp superfamily protein